jgi:hypothetical protein
MVVQALLLAEGDVHLAKTRAYTYYTGRRARHRPGASVATVAGAAQSCTEETAASDNAEGFFVMYTAGSTYLKATMDVQDKPLTPT